MKILEKSINKLLNEKPFFAHFFLNSKIVFDLLGVPTAGAAVTKESTLLVFNREFINSLNADEVCAVIEHEILHLLFEHVYIMRDNKSLFNNHIRNLAMDVAINQFIQGLPTMALTLDWANKQVGEQLEPEQTWEYYYSKLLKKADELGDASTLDSHDASMPGEVIEGEGKENLSKEIIKSTIDKAMKDAKGNVPNVVLKSYDAFKHNHKMPWQQILNNFVSRCVSLTTMPTRKKRNRRFGLDQPGKKKKRELVLGVCVDSSGSISDESYTTFMNELGGITKICQKVYFVEADCVVQDVTTIKKNKRFDANRKGCGGTAYQPAIDKCMELKCDAIVYFGDMDASDKPNNPGVPFLWAIVGGQDKAGDFGHEIRL